MTALAVAAASPFEDVSAAAGTSYDYWISTLTVLGEESSIAGPVTGVRAIAVCGNGVTEAPAEQCDDGGGIAGDGCDGACQGETAVGSGAGLCITTINDRMLRVAKAQGKENLACLSDVSGGSQSDANGCLIADEKGKVKRARDKTMDGDARFCSPPPDFGYAGGDVAAAAAETGRRRWLYDLFGDGLPSAIIAKASDADGAACQRAVAKGAGRLLTSYFASFSRCVKGRINDGLVFASGNLEWCFDGVAADSLDASSHIAMDVARLMQLRSKNCAGVDLSAAFPGRCSGRADTAFDSCIAVGAACRTCLLFDTADALGRDCDLLDNHAIDLSCN